MLGTLEEHPSLTNEQSIVKRNKANDCHQA